MKVFRAIARLTIAALVTISTAGFASQPRFVSAQACPTRDSNIYSFARSTLTACGIVTYPLSSTKRLPDGGTQYAYTEPNGTVTYRVPPPSFRASAASATQLALYAIPKRPADAASLAKWNKIVAKLHFQSAPPFSVVVPNVSACSNCSTIWSGYLATSPGFTQSNGEWVEHALGASRCSTYGVFFWTGLGGWNGNGDMGQVGTYEGNVLPSPFSNNIVWTEAYVNGAEQGIHTWNLWATTGQEVYATTAWDSIDGQFYNWFIENLYTGGSISVSSPSYPGGFNGATADFIVERPSIGGVPTNLANFGTMYYAEALANYGSYLGNLGPLAINMYSRANGGGTLLSTPSGLSGGLSFNVTQKSCN